MEDWEKIDVNVKYSVLDDISQMQEVLEQLPDVMESDAFPLPDATMEEEEPEERGAHDEGKTSASTEVNTTKVVKTPDATGEGEIEVVQLESDDSADDESSEEDLPLEEAADTVQQEIKVIEDDTKASITENSSKNEAGNGTDRGTADQAGPLDGGTTL